MVHFDSNSLRWCRQPIVIRAVARAPATRCLTLTVCMIRTLGPCRNTVRLTVDNLCWCCLLCWRARENDTEFHSTLNRLTRARWRPRARVYSNTAPAHCYTNDQLISALERSSLSVVFVGATTLFWFAGLRVDDDVAFVLVLGVRLKGYLWEDPMSSAGSDNELFCNSYTNWQMPGVHEINFTPRN